jgi:hypothetical protein
MFDYKAFYGYIGHLEQKVLKKENILAESDNYLIYYECESVELCIKNKEIPMILVGDHYGNPNDALISRQEDYLVSVGCGINLAFIKNINNDGYRYHCKFEEFLNTPENEWCVCKVFQAEEDPNEIFRFHCSNFDFDLAEYSFNTISKEIILCKVIEDLPDPNAL